MCGIVGISENIDAAKLAARMLHALQHRGQEAAGVVSREVTPHGTHFYEHRAPGLVGDTLSREEVIGVLHGDAAVGHVRYSTFGPKHTTRASQIADAQPLLRPDELALVHNGEITNAITLRNELEGQGVRFKTSIDSEVAMQLIGRGEAETLVDRITSALERLEGAYAFILLSQKKLIGICDPHGIRPLVFGRVGDGFAFASESCAFDIVKGEVLGEVKPGEIVVIESGDIARYRFAPNVAPRPCIFEHVYFSRPDSEWGDVSMYQARYRTGQALARADREKHGEKFFENAVVVPVLDSGLPAALGYAYESGAQFHLGLVRNHYAVGRSFIEPTQGLRDLKVLLKHNPNKVVVRGRRVIMPDDSAVRGTTSRLIVQMVREAGAQEVHWRVASSPVTHACYYGLDTATKELLAAGCTSVHEAEQRLQTETKADSVAFLTVPEMTQSIGCSSQCDACFTGNYPTPLTDR